MPRYFERDVFIAWLRKASQTPFTYYNRRRQLLAAIQAIAHFSSSTVVGPSYVMPTDVWVQLITTLDARNEAVNDNSRLFFRKFVEETIDELNEQEEVEHKEPPIRMPSRVEQSQSSERVFLPNLEPRSPKPSG